MQRTKPLIIAALIYILILPLFYLGGAMNRMENTFYDFLHQNFKKRSIDPAIQIVSLDDRTLEVLNSPWPLSRTYLAKALTQIAKDKPRLIALDFLFTEAKTSQEDRDFQQALDKIKIPIVASRQLLKEIDRIQNDPGIFILEESARIPVFPNLHTGFANVLTDTDGFIRKTDLKRSFKNDWMPVFALKIVCLLDQILCAQWEKTWAGQEFYIHFAGGEKTYPRAQFYSVLQGNLPPGFFKDKIVLIGPTFKESQDFHFVPTIMNEPFPVKMAGVEIHANILDNLLHQQFISRIKLIIPLFIYLFSGLFIFLLFYLNSLVILRKYLLVIYPVLLWLILFFLFIRGNLYIDFAFFIPQHLILTGLGFLLESRQRAEALKQEYDGMSKNELLALEIFCRKYDLSKREKEISSLIVRDFSRIQMAKKLFISENTIKRHINALYKKTQSASREDFLKLYSAARKTG
jgi:adenylate cyclase